MDKKCKDCFFCDRCYADEACEDYTPLNDDMNIDEMIELRRTDFHKEWFQYIEENIV